VLFWSTFLGAGPALLHLLAVSFGLAPLVSAGHVILGVACFAACSALGVISAFLMAVRGRGTPLPLAAARELVLSGPDRHVRNPMAIAGIGQGVAVGVFLADPCVVLYASAGACIWQRFVRPREEEDLLQRFGARYRRYRDAVPPWWPRRPPYADERGSEEGPIPDRRSARH
jgi:protein-S-isoprenylcysteine O-methyltransferase Ste14